MAKELTRIGLVGLELTREDVCDLVGMVGSVTAKAQDREVNCDVVDALAEIAQKLERVYKLITEIIENE